MTEQPPRCARCNSDSRVYPEGERNWHCTRCHVSVDLDPDEGGDWSDRNPAARLEREERRRTRGA